MATYTVQPGGQGRLRGGQDGQLPPLLSFMGEAGGARVDLQTELFPSLLSAEEAFSGIVDGLVQKNLSGGKPPDPQIIIALLGDRCITHYSSGK